MARQLKEIVDMLNAEPFSMDLSLVGFDEKEPFELMDEVLQPILVLLDSRHSVELRGEKPDAMYQRIAEFLHIMGYPCPFDIDFQQGLISGDKATIHPILYWLLMNLDQLQKRSYLSKFCVNFEVPEDFLREEQVYEIFQNYKELQSQFKTTHSHVEQERQGRMNPTDLQREVTQLDAEREQLAQKIAHLRGKSEKEEGFQVLLQVTSMLRKEQEEEARLGEKFAEQQGTLEQVEQMYIDRSARLREMREVGQQDTEASAEAMLRVLQLEVQRNREALARVRTEFDEKLQRMQQIEGALSEPQVTKSDLDILEGDITSMQAEIRSLDETVAEHNQDTRLTVYRQQANLVAKKKEQVLNDKKRIEEDKDALSKELTEKERAYEQARGHKFMKRDDFKNYAAKLRDKSAKFKRLKTDLSDLRQEVAMLTRTEQILQAKDPTPVGMRETEAMLEKASVVKGQVDKAKGKTLDEISTIVERINLQLKEKKNRLAPQIKALRSTRQKFQAVEVKYLEKKTSFDQAKTALDSELSKVSGEVRQLETDTSEAERQYHELNMRLCAADTRLHRANRESRCLRKEEQYSPQHATLGEHYQSETKSLDEQCVDLRKRQKAVKDTHEDNLRQKRAFSQLDGIMAMKLRVARREVQNFAEGRSAGDVYGTRPVTDLSTAGVERLVIE